MILDRYGPLFFRLLVLAALVLLPPVVVLSYSALDGLRAGMEPELEQKARALADDLTDQFGKALNAGIPLDKLLGVEEFLDPVLKNNDEVRYISIADVTGHRLYTSGEREPELDAKMASGDSAADQRKLVRVGSNLDYFVPLMVKGVSVGTLHVGLGVDYISGKVKSILVDVAVLSFVSFLFISEILLYVVAVNVSGPLGQIRRVLLRIAKGDFTTLVGTSSRDEIGFFSQRLNRAIRAMDERYRRLLDYVDEVRTAHFDPRAIEGVGEIESRVKFLYRFSQTGTPGAVHERQAVDARLALFLFVFAEELSRPFMALYTQSVPSSFPWLGADMMMALPIAAFMAVIALVSPWSGVIARKLGSRNVFMMGVVPAIVGFAVTGLADNSAVIVAGRIASGLGYAMITMACQVYMSGTVKDETRTQGLSVFVGAVLTASVCGAGVGGILVERIGFRGVFFVAAVFAAIACWLARGLPDMVEDDASTGSIGLHKRLLLLKNWRFSTLMLFSAIPSKIAVTGVAFFLVPLYLWKMDLGYADISRIVMLYGAVVVALSPVVARWADRTGWRLGLVVAGGMIGSIALLAPALDRGVLAVVVAMIGLGVANGLGASAQLALIPDICWTECRSLGQAAVLAEARRLERIGSTAGPLIAAALVPFADYGWSIVFIGGGLAVMSVVFLIVSLMFGRDLHIEAEEVGE